MCRYPPHRLERKLLGNVTYYNDYCLTHQDESYMKEMYDVRPEQNDNYFVRTYAHAPDKIEMSFNLSTYQPHLADAGGRPPDHCSISIQQTQGQHEPREPHSCSCNPAARWSTVRHIKHLPHLCLAAPLKLSCLSSDVPHLPATLRISSLCTNPGTYSQPWGPIGSIVSGANNPWVH